MSWLCFLLFASYSCALMLESRVFSGDDLRFDGHKHLVKLKILSWHNWTALCSGSILNNFWIITSAHCFIGDEKQVSIFHQSEEGQRIIAKVVHTNKHVHPEWIPDNKSIANRANDLALLKTSRSIKFSDHVQPIKLSRTFPRCGQSGIIAGYGESEPELDPPREGFVSIEPCLFGVPGLLCSTELVRAGSGDSGGSLVSSGRLVGVTAASCRQVREPKECTTVYVSVSSHIAWIDEMMLTLY